MLVAGHSLCRRLCLWPGIIMSLAVWSYGCQYISINDCCCWYVPGHSSYYCGYCCTLGLLV